MYTEHGSKNRNSGFFQLHVDNKEVSIFKNPSAGQRCLVSLLDVYLSKLREKAKEADIFYCRPLEKFTDNGPWYSAQPRDKHVLNEMVKKMCSEADQMVTIPTTVFELQEQHSFFRIMCLKKSSRKSLAIGQPKH